jgi:hypothetical protein
MDNFIPACRQYGDIFVGARRCVKAINPRRYLPGLPGEGGLKIKKGSMLSQHRPFDAHVKIIYAFACG